MIKFSNVGKTYISKSKSKVDALKDVNFELGANGMTFILGKSGSGKSTLLNLLGGLDKPTTGSIQVDGVDMQSFKQADFENYRNSYVGFVFQEYNLLDDFNIKDNVALALQLSKDTDVNQKVIEALKQVELGEEYLTRRVGELSGGEKQRVAIARALVKESRMILADEPTGNLDSATGESIWNILKSLSRERLVVVVSHDRESAEKYADRTIEIADGRVIADNGAQLATDNGIKPQANKQSRLSFAIRLKMGYSNLRLRKGKTVSVILIAIFSILSILITQMCVSFSPEVTVAEYMLQNNVDYFVVGQGYIDQQYNKFSPNNGKPLYKSTQEFIADNARYIKNSLIESKQDILDMGLTFVGDSLELDDHSYYITATRFEEWSYSNGKVEVDGEYVDIVKEYHPIEYLIGKKVRLGYLDNTDDWVLAGVIDDSKIVNASALPGLFYTEDFEGIYISYEGRYNHRDVDYVLHFGNKQYCQQFSVFCEGLFYGDRAVLTSDGIWNSVEKLTLADDEIVITYELYAELFDAKSKWYYINSDFDEVHYTPPEIGKTFPLKFSSFDNGEIIVDYGEVKLAGIVFTQGIPRDENKARIWTNRSLEKWIIRDLDRSTVLIQTSSIKNLSAFTTTFRRDHLGVITNAGYVETTVPTAQDTNYKEIASECYAFEQTMMFVSIMFFVVGTMLIIVLILLVINLISFSIANRKKEIGILSAIGASNRDITSIFLLETSIIAAISFVIIFVLSFVSAWVINALLSNMLTLSITIPFLRVGILTVAILIASSFGLMLLAALIPIRKIIQLKPIDAIRAL